MKALVLQYEIPKGIIHVIIGHHPTLHFNFKQLNQITISDGGLTLKHTDEIFHSVRFGEFLHAKDNIIYKVIFKFKQVRPDLTAIGFITPEFEEKMDPSSTYNSGSNHSCWIQGIGYFVNSENDFESKYVSKDFIEGLDYLFDKGNKLHVEVDMIQQKGRMWNDKDKGRKIMFEIGLPESVAIFVVLSRFGIREISAVEQEFRYK